MGMMIRIRLQTYRRGAAFNLLAAALLLALLAGCPPPKATREAEGTYLVARSKMYGDDSQFDLRDTVVYPEVRTEGIQDPSVSVSDQQLTVNRCTWCHECGFQDAFDWEDYGAADWSPRYVGEEWQAPLQRMMEKENTYIQEERIVERIYGFLHDATLGTYDEQADDRGAVVIEVDEAPPEENGTGEGSADAPDEDEAPPAADEGGGGEDGSEGAVA